MNVCELGTMRDGEMTTTDTIKQSVFFVKNDLHLIVYFLKLKIGFLSVDLKQLNLRRSYSVCPP